MTGQMKREGGSTCPFGRSPQSAKMGVSVILIIIIIMIKIECIITIIILIVNIFEAFSLKLKVLNFV